MLAHIWNGCSLNHHLNTGIKCFTSSRRCTVRPELVISCHQVRREQPGAAGCRRLHDCLPERSDSSQEDARHQLAEEMLPDDRQEVRVKISESVGAAISIYSSQECGTDVITDKDENDLAKGNSCV